jgi:hypothetical protein
MFCGYCGEQLNKSDKFCLNCGETTNPIKQVADVKSAVEPERASKVEDFNEENVGEKSDDEPLFGFLRSSRFWKIIGVVVVACLVFIPSAIYFTSKPNSENHVRAAETSEPATASPAPTQLTVEPSSEPKTTGTPTPKASKSTKTEALLCRTISQFGEEKQCFKLSETTQLTVESKYGDCPILNANNGTCDMGSVVIVPTDRGSVIKPCSPGGDIKYSVNGISGGVIGGGETDSLRNETCSNKSANTLPFILNRFPPLSFVKNNSITEARYTLSEIGVEVLDEYIN